ncbi:BapA prefix-like domain-containing protein, partial [Acinetobacter sp. WCHAc060033]|uniref:Ig-like domain-containing protein n=1 Tax=Acinetobacter sp. WCHAc060033 TaxID=2518624 RepID=UPI0010237810
MTNITIIGKESHQVLELVGVNKISLQDNSVVILKIPKDDVKSMVREGNSLVITLKNGETITIENYYNNQNNADNTVVFQENDGSLFVPGETTPEGVIVNYNPIDSIEPLLYHDGIAPVVPWILGAVGAGAVAAIAGSSDGDDNKDTTAPVKPVIDPIEAGSKDPIKGTGEAGAEVTVTYPDGSTVTATVGTDGKWSVPNPGLKDGDKVTAVVTDPAGNKSDPVTAEVNDTTPPDQPVLNLIEAGSKDPITGTAEPSSEVTVTYPDKTTATVTAGTDGKWSVVNPGLEEGEKVTAVATDPAGNKSDPVTTEVKDTTPPDQPELNPIEAGSKDPITGTAEPGSEVTVTYPDKTTATVTAGTDGKWSVPNPGLKEGGEVIATATDPSGNESKPATEIVGKDVTAPETPAAPTQYLDNTDPVQGTFGTGTS